MISLSLRLPHKLDVTYADIAAAYLTSLIIHVRFRADDALSRFNVIPRSLMKADSILRKVCPFLPKYSQSIGSAMPVSLACSVLAANHFPVLQTVFCSA